MSRALYMATGITQTNAKQIANCIHMFIQVFFSTLIAWSIEYRSCKTQVMGSNPTQDNISNMDVL